MKVAYSNVALDKDTAIGQTKGERERHKCVWREGRQVCVEGGGTGVWREGRQVRVEGGGKGVYKKAEWENKRKGRSARVEKTRVEWRLMNK